MGGQQDHQRPGLDKRPTAFGHELEDRVEVDLAGQGARDLACGTQRGDRSFEFVAATLQLVEPPGVVDADGRVLGEDQQQLLVGLVELRTAGLLGQVDVAVDLAADHDRTAEECLHLGVPGREAVRVWMPRQVGEPEDLRVRDELAQHAAAEREVADDLAFVLVDADGEEARERIPLLVEEAERGVACPGQLLCGAQHAARGHPRGRRRQAARKDRDEPAGGPTSGRVHRWSGLEQLVLDGVAGELRARRQVELALDARPGASQSSAWTGTAVRRSRRSCARAPAASGSPARGASARRPPRSRSAPWRSSRRHEG